LSINKEISIINFLFQGRWQDDKIPKTHDLKLTIQNNLNPCAGALL